MNIVIHSRRKYFLLQNSRNYPWHWIIFPMWPRSAKLDNHKRHSVMFLKVSHAMWSSPNCHECSVLRIGLNGRESRITAPNEVCVPLQCDVIRGKMTFIKELRISCLISIQHRHPSLTSVIRDSLPLRPIRNADQHCESVSAEHSWRFGDDHMAWLTLGNMTLCLLWLSNLADLGHIGKIIHCQG